MAVGDLLNHSEVEKIITLALQEDHVENDHTTNACLLENKQAFAEIIAKKDTIACGAPLAKKIIDLAVRDFQFQPIELRFHADDGTTLHNGQKWIELHGRAQDILRIERTLLNFLMRMCGIAKTTNNVVNLIRHTDCKLLHTRKTIPGHRRTDVYATLVGGAHAHRLHLADAILVKENHLRSASSFQSLFDEVQKRRSENKFIEIEVTDLQELKHALMASPDRVLLDNFSVELTQKATTLFGGRVEMESSGGITLENAAQYAETGVEYMSMGWITHSIVAADLSLLFKVL